MDEHILRFRHNVMNVTSLSSFANLKGSISQDCKEVYFIRAVGVNQTLLSDVVRLDEVLGTQMQEGKVFYKRIDSLPKLSSMDDANYYSNCYMKWLDCNKLRMEIKSSVVEERLITTLAKACLDVLHIFHMQNTNISESIEKNFIVKMLFWFDFVMLNQLTGWSEHSTIKIVAQNIDKRQEYLFFYLLTLIGADVLLIQNEKDIDIDHERLTLSCKLVLGEMGSLTIPVKTHQSNKVQTSVNQASQNQASQVRSNANQTSTNRTSTNQSNRIQLEESQSGRNIIVHIPERNRSKTNNNSSVSQISDNNRLQQNQQSSIHNSQRNSQQNRSEKSFEELALLASSVVMIEIHERSGQIIGSGSGIMVGKNGYILTNNHVATGGTYYSVRIEDDNQIYTTDEVIKYNSVLDLAIIRIQRVLHPIPVYKGKDKLVRGQKVVAIGSPLGLFNSVSNGIISGFRLIDNVDMIQFTAPISHGSSGGAVLNMYGEVIGISTAGIDRGQNINLAMGYECINSFIKGFV